MYILNTRTARAKDRKRSNGYRAKLKAKNRRRVNRMANRRLSARRGSK
jgi:hypothetical protein